MARTFTTFEELAQEVAKYFVGVMKEEDFDTFSEMTQCYWWTLEDIKGEVDSIIISATDYDACLSDDGCDVYMHGTDMMISYRSFSKMWHKAIVDMMEVA